MTTEATIRVLRHIVAHRTRASVRLLDVIYGPQALQLRRLIASEMLERRVSGGEKASQYGAVRKLLLRAVGASGDCTASEDVDFNTKAEAMLALAPPEPIP